MKAHNSSLVHCFSRASVLKRNLCRRRISRTGEDVVCLDKGLLPYRNTRTSVPITQCSRRYMRCCVVVPVWARKILRVSLFYRVISQQCVWVCVCVCVCC